MTTATETPARTPVSPQIAVLDEAYERLAANGFFTDNGFVHHGPMAVEALADLGHTDRIADWAIHNARYRGVDFPSAHRRAFDWQSALGDRQLLPEWFALFDDEIAEKGPETVIALWVPRLIPALSTALFHAAIRVGHAVRSIDHADTPARRAELSRALAFWAVTWAPGRIQPRVDDAEVDPEGAIWTLAGRAAEHFSDEPSIYSLHGVTGTAAAALLAPHLDDAGRRLALGVARAEYTSLYRATDGSRRADDAPIGAVLPEMEARIRAAGDVAAAGLDAHQVKLIDACLRGYQASAASAFVIASEVVIS